MSSRALSGTRPFRNAAPTLWNRLPNKLHQEKDIASFRRQLKSRMENSAEKTKPMTNNTSGINKEIRVNGQELETVTSFKYLGSVITDEGSKSEILSRIEQTTAALTRLKLVWNDKNISLSSKTRLMRSLVKSIFLCACK